MTSIGEIPRGSHFESHRLPIGRAADLHAFAASPKRTRSRSPHPDAMDTTSATLPSKQDKSTKNTDEDDRNPETAVDANAGDANGVSNAVTSVAHPAPAGAKVVQTAFIHKLYSMLEDQTIQHLISWSGSGESFVMCPSTEFSKVLASYFKHTNISSFVRQLNMYGFHKVSDVFHGGSPDSPMWEFKHGGGNFNRGDINGLREIKRRASRHTLIHRDSFSGPTASNPSYRPSVAISGPTPPLPQAAHPQTNSHTHPHPQSQSHSHPPPPPPPPTAGSVSHPHPIPSAAPIPSRHAPPALGEPVRNELAERASSSAVEHSFHDIYARLARTEDVVMRMNTRCRVLTEGLTKCHQWSGDLASHLVALVPDRESKIHKDACALHQEIAIHIEALRAFDSSANAAMQASMLAPRDAGPPRPHKPSISRDALATSPRLYAIDPSRRPSLQVTGASSTFKTPMPPMHNASPHRPGGLLVPDERVSPSSGRLQSASHIALPPPQGPGTHHLNSPTMNAGRRHTAADIHSHGWAGVAPSHAVSSPPIPSRQQSINYPSSPYRQPSIHVGDQQIRDKLAQYEMAPKAGSVSFKDNTPPPDASSASYANAHASNGDPGSRLFKAVDFSAPATRRSSMASNVHNLLNPAEGGERGSEDGEDRKRKRLA